MDDLLSQTTKPKKKRKSKVPSTPVALMSFDVCTPRDSSRGPEPIRQGIPLAKGMLSDANEVCLVDEHGRAIAMQTRVLARWADGSVQWLLLDFLHVIDAAPKGSDKSSTTYHVRASRHTIFGSKPLRIAQESDDSTISVESPWGQVLIGYHGDSEFLHIENQWKCCLDVSLVDGRELTFNVEDVAALESGPIRTVVVISGDLIDEQSKRVLSCRAEIHLVANVRLMRCTLTLGNPSAATHPGGIWELGDPNSVEIAEATVVMEPFDEATNEETRKVRWSVDEASDLKSSSLPWSLYQDSSGGENWNSNNHVDRHGDVPLQFRGYRLTTGDDTTEGFRANPFVELRANGNNSLAVSYSRFWENFPKSLSISTSELRIGLFPAESNRPHELQPGEQKTHQFWMGGSLETLGQMNDNTQATSAVRSVHQPSTVKLQSSAVGNSSTIPWLTPKSSDSNSTYLSLVDAAIVGGDTFFQKRETIDQYGWRHFGDVYGDHEAVFSDAKPPLISHFNNQYDQVLGFGIQYLRGGDDRWIEMMRDLAWHVVDIDIYHATTDKKAYNGGQFWHTCHYIGAGKATHRSYPTGSCGGGPASEQGYARGLGLYYFLTGEELIRQTVGRMGEWIIAADDGSTTPFRWLSKQCTGLTSASGTLDYQGPGRGAGNAIEVSVAAFETTGRQEFLDEAEKLIRRVIHPLDDIESRNLLDAERRWYYTLFLQSLGRYLWVKHQHGQYDYMYGYGRASLLHYATWMSENEYPYLTKPEILDYPTETWAAQDMRKCEVFQWASLHATGDLRTSLLERAKFFFDYSTETLAGMETRSLCRPVALLLSNGYSRACFENEESIPSLPATGLGVSHDFGQPTRFVPQKIQAVNRAKLIAVAGVAISIFAFGILAWLLIS